MLTKKDRPVKTLEQAVKVDGSISRQLAHRAAKLANMQDQITRAQKKADEYAANSLADIFEEFAAVKEYLFMHRDMLISDKKSGELPGGAQFEWYLSGSAVVISGKHKKIIEKLKELKLDSLIRVKESIDKEAILKEPEKVKGAGITGLKVRGPEALFAYRPRGRDEVFRYNEASGEVRLENPKVEKKKKSDEDEE